MIPGVPVEARWVRLEPRRTLPPGYLERIVGTAFPSRVVVDVQHLSDGLRNANFRLQIESISGSPSELVVLRIYEHDASLCRKEVDLLHLIGHSVPVPEVIHAEPEGLNDIPPFVLFRFVQGISFQELKRSGDAASICEAAFAVGQTLALIGRTIFPQSGWIGPGPHVSSGLMQGPRFVDLCLASSNLQGRMEADLRDRTQALVWSCAQDMASLDDERCLVHGDFGKRNLMLQRVAGKWTVAAVLDWEFAISGTPLIDIGHFLRYERAARPVAEPHFSEGFVSAGGKLPPGWCRLARAIDLIALCESLTHDELPDAVVAELIELIRATVEDRDPQQ